jgi:MFS family permease
MRGWFRTPVFYGWWMVSAASVLQFMQSALLQQSFGAYMAVLRDEMGWSKTSLSAAAVIQQVESAILGPVQGWFVDRFGPQWMIRIGIVLFGTGFMLVSRVQTLYGFYGAFVVMALGSGLCGFFPLTVALLHWFERKRARALSAMQLGYAVGGMAVPVIAWSLITFGWRATAFASGVFIIAVGLPLSTIIKRRPEDHGEVVDGIREPVAEAAKNPAPAPDFTAREAVRTPAFLFISLGHGFALFVVSAVMVHAITHLKEGLGYGIGEASLIIGLMTLCQAAGILLSGFIGDRFDKCTVSAVCMLFHMVGMLLLTYAASIAMLIGFAVLHGVSWGTRGPLMQAIRADYFGRSSIGMIMGLSSIIVLLGQVSGPLIAGVLADYTGDYEVGFTVLALLAGAGSMFFFLAKKPKRPTQTATT